MRIDSPKMTNAEVTGSFKGSFSGSFEGDIQADSVQYANVLSKPSLLSGSAQIASDISGSFDSLSGSIASRIATHESNNTVDVTLNTSTGPDYLTISGQEISVGTIDISADTNFAVSDTTGQTGVDLTLTDDTLSATLAGLDTSDSPTFAALTVNGAITVTGNVDGRDLSTDGTKLDTIEENADVTDTANVTAAGALMDSEVDADIKTLSLPANTTISSFGKTLVDDADAAAARSTLGVDAAGTDNSTDVTLSGTPDYITISGQTITRNQIDLTSDVTGDLPISEGGTGASTAAAARSNLGVDAAGTDNSTDVTLGGSLDYITISGQTITRNAINLSTDVTGTLPVGNMAATALTTIQTAANQTAHLALTAQEGDVVVRSDENKTYMHNGGTAGTMADYTLLATPTDAVTSVNGNTGVVTVTENVTTNLSTTANGTSLVINSSDGTNASIPAATTSAWGAMTDEDKAKLDGIAASANNYTHPTFAGDDISVDTGALTGAVVISDLDFNVTTDTNGHVTDANGTVATRTLTLADLGYTGATDANNITNNNQLTNGAGYITSYTDTNTVTSVGISGDLSTGNITLAGSGATSVTKSGGTITITSTDTNTNTTYSAGTGLDLSGTTFSIEPDLRDSITHIGLDTTDYIQFVNNDYTRTVVNGTERLRVDTAGIDVSGRIVADGDITAYSDEKLKKDVSTIENALDKTKQLRGVEFTRIADESRSIGVIAQELEKVLPELVSTDEEGMKAVNYGQITGLLIEAVKELSAKVEALENK